MKLSLIIPAYNEEKYIKRCLASILAQSSVPDEIIVVDNNSTDQTASIAKKMGVKVIRERNQGMIQARNAGFNFAKYPILARCDADTILPLDWVSRVKYNFQVHDIDALSGPVVYPDHPIMKYRYPSLTYAHSMHTLVGTPILIGPHMAISRDIWQKVKKVVHLDNKLVHEDVDLSLNIFKFGGKILHDPNLVVQTSSRRLKNNPSSFLVEYPVRLFKTIRAN